MFRNHRFEKWLCHMGGRLQYIYRSLKAGCRMSYKFGEHLYLRVQTATGFIVHIIDLRTDDVLGVIHDSGRVCQCV